MFPCLGFLVADPSCSYRAPLFSLASALLQRSCEQLQPYVGNDSTPCRLALFLTLARLPDVRAFSSRSRDISHFTVTLNHPPVARYLALHRKRSEPNPISIAAYHRGTQPSLALRTHLCSERSECSSKGPNSDLDCGIPPRYPASHLWPIRTKVRSRLRHTTKVPSHLWLTTRSITRSRRPWQ